MKLAKKILFPLFFISVTFFACNKNTESTSGLCMKKFQIKGMVCNGCAESIESALKETEGVKENKVVYSDSIASITFDSTQVSKESLIAAIGKAGYTALER